MSKAKRGREPKNVIRILMIGNSGVGKTSLVLRYDENTFSHKFVTTIGVDYRDKMVEIAGKSVKLQIWDTAGQERFRSLTSNFFSRADGMLLTYDVSDRSSFESLSEWVFQIRKHAPEGVDLLVCGCKSDVPLGDREISPAEAETFAESIGTNYFECSSKNNVNVPTVFMTLARKIAEKRFSLNERDSIQLPSTKSSVSGEGEKRIITCC
mmetsp:Transcript_49013/g.66797  ORF Transcript_49013/g.66797 Transcript_49013/m.66797 type:complete len:210 (-) Transcript_49013:154-783(-)